MIRISPTKFLLTSCCFSLLVPTAWAQPSWSKGKGGSNSGGFSSFMMKDPSQTFDFLSRGRGYFLVTDTRFLREPLEAWAKQKGITNGQITREHFLSFSESMKTKFSDGGMASPFSKGTPSGTFPAPGGMTGPPGSGPGTAMLNPQDAMNQFAESEFKRRDDNGDGFLNVDEVSSSLREDFPRWDTNRDNLIDPNEFKAYMTHRMQNRGSNNAPPANPVTVIVEEELDQRPVLLRAGKLPKEMPKWFGELDIDADGQVSLYEWRKGGKDMEEFSSLDRNDDGLLTPEEVLRTVNNSNATAKAGTPGNGPTGGFSTGGSGSRFGGGFPGGGFSGGGPPGGGFSGGFPFRGSKTGNR